MLRLFIPPEWSSWSTADRIAYAVSLACFWTLCGVGAAALLGMLNVRA